jgi:hypothetical protein
MAGKFGLVDESDELPEVAQRKIDLSGFPPVVKRSPIDVARVDAVAASHGFVSREAISPPTRRRRTASTESARHLAIRMTETEYKRFVAYADLYELTYSGAIKKLLDLVDG